MIEYRQLIQIIAMFCLVQFGGLYLATLVFNGATYAQVHSSQPISSGISIVYYVVYIALVALILSFIMKVWPSKKFFVVMEGLVVFVTSFFVFAVLAGSLTGQIQNIIFGSAPPQYFIIAAIAAIILIVAKNKYGRLKNATAMISSVGFGLILGISFGFYVALLFMALLAVYDFIAVFITKHMITLANAATEQNLALMIEVNDVEAVPRSYLSSAQLLDYNKNKAEMEKRFPLMKGLESKKMVPVSARVALGTGDLGVPLMLAISAYSLTSNFTLSFFVVFGALLGLLITMLVLRRLKRALPAIPPILIGVLIGIGAYLLVFKVL